MIAPSPLQAAFVTSLVTWCAHRVTPRMRPFVIVVLAPGERPRLAQRSAFASELRSAGMNHEAHVIARTPTKPTEVAFWITSAAASGLLRLPIERASEHDPAFALLPADDVLSELL